MRWRSDSASSAMSTRGCSDYRVGWKTLCERAISSLARTDQTGGGTQLKELLEEVGTPEGTALARASGGCEGLLENVELPIAEGEGYRLNNRREGQEMRTQESVRAIDPFDDRDSCDGYVVDQGDTQSGSDESPYP